MACVHVYLRLAQNRGALCVEINMTQILCDSGRKEGVRALSQDMPVNILELL